jgi:ABC-2 type transport system permease protein
VVAALYILLCLIPGGINPAGIQMGGRMSSGAPGAAATLFIGVQLMFVALLYAVMSIVVFFYLADCLYAERKDRSILFWKSLPVPDSATVLSKLLVAVLVVPLGVYVLAFVTNLVAFGILFARFHASPVLGQLVQWNTGAWLRLNLVLITDVLVLALWFAPVAAYQLLVSAWAKSNVFVWTILPPLLLIIGERLVFGTWTVAALLGQRLGPGFSNFRRPAGLLSGGPAVTASQADGIFQRSDSLGLLATPHLWIGLAVAAALIYAAIRIRRYRDDS